VFVPVPDGVAYEDALRAVEDARPWVAIESTSGLSTGARVRHEWSVGGRDLQLYVHPDDVPNPDADLRAGVRQLADAITSRYATDEQVDALITLVRNHDKGPAA
jgi:hypothetical protein